MAYSKDFIRFIVIYVENVFPTLAKQEDPYSTVERLLDEGEGISIKEIEGSKFLEIVDSDEVLSVEITKELIRETFVSFEVSRKNYEIVSTIPEHEFTEEVGNQLLKDSGADCIVEDGEQDEDGSTPRTVYHIVKVLDANLDARVAKIEI